MYLLLVCVQLFLLFSLFLATYDLKTTLSQSSWILRWKQTNKKETKEKRKKDRNNGEKESMLYRLSFCIDVIPSVFVCLSVQLPTFEVLLSILFLLRFELFCFFFCPKNLRIYGQQAVKTWKECLSPESCCQCPAILSTNALAHPLDSQIFLVLSRCTSLLSTLSHWVFVIDGRNWVGVLERCLRIFCQRAFP
jgi:hypothetical protein